MKRTKPFPPGGRGGGESIKNSRKRIEESMEDLLLNSLALDLVLTLDELIFEALAPDSARIFIAQVAPVCTGALPSWRGADAKAVALPISIALLMAASWFGFLQHMVENLKRANEVMCGGELDFTYELDAFDVGLAHYGAAVIKRRVSVVAELRNVFESMHQKIAINIPMHFM